MTAAENLYLHLTVPGRVVVLGEVLWDVFSHSRNLGGAPLNFGAHVRRLGHDVSLLSAVGADDLGQQAVRRIAGLQLDTTLLQITGSFPTGTATVELSPDGRTLFKIQRPAAYDAIQLSDRDIEQLRQSDPAWLYYGTLFASAREGWIVLERLLEKLDETVKFYDLNLRPGSDSPELIVRLLERANVVKLNEEELQRVHDITGLPLSIEAFCRGGTDRYGWKAVSVTLGGRGCAILADGQYVEAEGCPVDVVDTVGAGDAFAAAFMHGLSSNWLLSDVAAFANRAGALAASHHGAIPNWTFDEMVNLP